MDDDEGKVETGDTLHGEVVAVDGPVRAVSVDPVPSVTFHNDFIDIVFVVVEVVVYLASALDRDVVFSRVSAHDKGNVFLIHK